MHQGMTRKQQRIIIISAIGFLIGLVLLVGFIFRDTGKNQYGNRIRIQNYNQVVDNLSNDMRDSIEAYLYTVVELNYEENFNGASVKDAYIREDSHDQTHSSGRNLYDGNFIIDIESLKQSYGAQYSYSTSDELATVETSSSPVVISCLSADALKYGEFDCKDLVSDYTSPTDTLLQHLPYTGLSFSITPHAEDAEKMELIVTLSIPQIDLSGDTTSKQQVIAMYKKEVTDWIASKDANLDDYTLRYNYSDNGDYLDTSHNH